jgi:hypothetical protein
MSDDLFEFLAAQEAGSAAHEAGCAAGKPNVPQKCVNHRQDQRS